MNGLEFSAIVRAADRCALAIDKALVSPATDHTHSIQRQLGRESPLLPGLGFITSGRQLIAHLGKVLNEFACSLFDPGLPGIWDFQRPTLLDMAQQFLSPAKDFPVTVWCHTTYWTDRCIAQAFFDSDISQSQRVDRRWYGRQQPVKLCLDRRAAVTFSPLDLAWLLPVGIRRQEIEFAKTRQQASVFAAPEGRWFAPVGTRPTYAQPTEGAFDLFGGTYRERIAPAYPAGDINNWIKLGLHPSIGQHSYDLFVHREVPEVGSDFGLLTVVPAGPGNNPPAQHDLVCSQAILDLSVLNFRRLLPATISRLAGVHSDELSVTFEPQRGFVASVGIKREWIPEADRRRGLNAGEIARLEPFLDAASIRL
jgi:hypothetical protein